MNRDFLVSCHDKLIYFFNTVNIIYRVWSQAFELNVEQKCHLRKNLYPKNLSNKDITHSEL